MIEQKITIGTVCFLLDEPKKRILLLKRLNEPMKGMYTGVGGKTHFEEDIYTSCVREVKEETGFDVKNLKLKGVIKTVLQGQPSSWILFVYTTSTYSGSQIICPEGELEWVSTFRLNNYNLIGFIREILPNVMNDSPLIEGTIVHNTKGEVIEKRFN